MEVGRASEGYTRVGSESCGEGCFVCVLDCSSVWASQRMDSSFL